MSELVDFIEGTGVNNHGESLEEIHMLDFKDIERRHDIIQWVFPLNVPSQHLINCPILTEGDINNIDLSFDCQANMLASRDWFVHFLSRTQHWRKPKDHNLLRISRAIQSLRLLCGDTIANDFRSDVLDEIGDFGAQIIGTVTFWKNL